jgi:hypothetical protein
MRFWTTDWSYSDFFNRLGYSANFAFQKFSESRVAAVLCGAAFSLLCIFRGPTALTCT